jgi:hypothetical protein
LNTVSEKAGKNIKRNKLAGTEKKIPLGSGNGRNSGHEQGSEANSEGGKLHFD